MAKLTKAERIDLMVPIIGLAAAEALFSGDPRVEEKLKEAGFGAEAAEPHFTGTETFEELAEIVGKDAAVDISTRITWGQYGMQLATTAALRGDCRRRQVGAVLMGEDHSVISMGYNGGPSKGKSCLAGQCPRGLVSKEEAPGNSRYDEGLGTCVALHAEWNVLLRTSWDQFEGSTLYVTHKPCHICSVLISGTRIRRVVAPGYDWVAYL